MIDVNTELLTRDEAVDRAQLVRVRVVDIDLSISSLMMLLFKLLIAGIPVWIVLFLIGIAFAGVIGALGGLTQLPH